MQKHLISLLVLFMFLSTSFVGVSTQNEKAIIQKPSNLSDGGLMNSSWPMFCHDERHTGQSPYGVSGNYIYEKWKIRLYGFVTFSSPVIASDGTIYIGTQKTLEAINPNGTEKWFFNIWIESSPAIAEDGTIYIGAESGNFYAINPNGTEKWHISLKWGIISSPVIAQDGTIFIGANEKMCAINPNGTLLWSYMTGDTIKASPAIGNDGTVYVASHDGYMYAFYPTNGTLKWRLQIAPGSIECYSSPAIDNNGIIYYGTVNGIFAINPNGTVKWVHYGGGCYYGGPVISYDGTIYACGGDTLYAYRADGSIKWSIWMGAYMVAPAITKDGMIYAIKGFGADHGSDTVSLISPNGTIVSSVRLVADVSYDTADLESSPTIGVDGTVYLGSWFIGSNPGDVGYLHAIGTIYNQAPKTPAFIGPTTGDVGKNCTFQMQTTDPDGNQIYYYVDWGDNTNSGWVGPFESGTNVSMNHTWYNGGDYTIRVTSKDVYNDQSGWSDPLQLHLFGPNIVIKARGGFGIHMIIKNIGDKPAYNVICFMNMTLFPRKLVYPKKTHFEKIEPVIDAGSTKIVWVFCYGFGAMQWAMTMKTEKFSEGISRLCGLLGPFVFGG